MTPYLKEPFKKKAVPITAQHKAIKKDASIHILRFLTNHVLLILLHISEMFFSYPCIDNELADRYSLSGFPRLDRQSGHAAAQLDVLAQHSHLLREAVQYSLQHVEVHDAHLYQREDEKKTRLNQEQQDASNSGNVGDYKFWG